MQGGSLPQAFPLPPLLSICVLNREVNSRTLLSKSRNPQQPYIKPPFQFNRHVVEQLRAIRKQKFKLRILEHFPFCFTSVFKSQQVSLPKPRVVFQTKSEKEYRKGDAKMSTRKIKSLRRKLLQGLYNKFQNNLF
ncbi:hypothetical protein CDAR_252071 [Caerostris darwini]|uniref:Uncharacterized protein n=1 Tax=Caerostris darwini TaxID=1538125 RepID=A0AAV4N6T5_9ARAC|nr:hypothetical protein CDAR_252071 [Caerostris darwini]